MYALVALFLAAGPAQLSIEVQPTESIIYVDGKKLGDGSKTRTLQLKAGTHLVKVSYKGDSHEEEVVVKGDEKKLWKWTFEDDRPADANQIEVTQ